MNYHNITKDEMLNGEDLGVVLWTSGCTHRCNSCQNQQTWNSSSGILFDDSAKQEIFEQLDHDYISRLTLSGGDPMHKNNVNELIELVKEVREKYGNTKKVWVYTGYTFEQLLENKNNDDIFNKRYELMSVCDVLVDGRFYKHLADVNYPWAGSTNQRVIDIQQSIQKGEIVLYDI